MEDTNWLKQSAGKPLFPDLLWSRPENKSFAGKLLIIGGNQHGFAAPISSYNAALKAGIGSARVILPDVLKRAIGVSFHEAIFVPSTPSGSLAKRALDTLLEEARWADGILLAGNFGRNSETAILLSIFLEKYNGQVTVAQDGLDYFLTANSPLLYRPEILSVINMGKLHKLVKNSHSELSIRHAMSLYELVQVLSKLDAQIMTKHADNYIAAAGGRVSTTPADKDQSWQIELAAYASVWQIQDPSTALQAATTAIYSYTGEDY